MNNLLERAVAAHGGLDRWNQVNSITVGASITGALWHVKGKVDALKDVRFEVDTKRQLLTMDYVGQDKRSVFEPHRVVISAVMASISTHATSRRGRLTVISSPRADEFPLSGRSYLTGEWSHG